jgi:hypothetical protein
MNSGRGWILFDNIQLLVKSLNFTTYAAHETMLQAWMLKGGTFTKDMLCLAERTETRIATGELVDQGVVDIVLSRSREQIK